MKRLILRRKLVEPTPPPPPVVGPPAIVYHLEFHKLETGDWFRVEGSNGIYEKTGRLHDFRDSSGGMHAMARLDQTVIVPCAIYMRENPDYEAPGAQPDDQRNVGIESTVFSLVPVGTVFYRDRTCYGQAYMKVDHETYMYSPEGEDNHEYATCEGNTPIWRYMEVNSSARAADTALQRLSENGGLLSSDQTDEFVNMLLNTPELRELTSRSITMSPPVRRINRISFGRRILEGAADPVITPISRVTFDRAVLDAPRHSMSLDDAIAAGLMTAEQVDYFRNLPLSEQYVGVPGGTRPEDFDAETDDPGPTDL